MSEGVARRTWTFLTNHGHVLVCLAEDPGIRGCDIAARVGITERAAQSIIADLVAEGYVTRTRVGRRNRYEIHPDAPLRHPIERGHSVGEVLVSLSLPPGPATGTAPRKQRHPAADTATAQNGANRHDQRPSGPPNRNR